MVKSSKPQLKYICFGKDGERIYKGEGTLTFTAYYPFAKSIFKFLNEYSDKNKDEWKEASGMKAEKGTYDTVSNNGSISVYNAGDLEADFILKFSLPVDNTPIGDIKITLSKENVGKVEAFLDLNGFSKKGADTGFQINTKTNLIEGFNAEGLTGTLYNENITQGDFFKIPPREEGYQISVTGAIPTEIVYDYIYY